jgi:NAD kinase
MLKSDVRIVIVIRPTRLAQVLETQNTSSQAKFYINSLGGDFGDYEREDNQYRASVERVKRDLSGIGTVHILQRRYLTNFIFAKDDIVAVVGQDGLVANTMKYLDGQPVVGINPDPSRWDGVLLPFLPKNAASIIKETAAGKRKFKEVSMARAQVQNGQELLAVNDFFIGQKTHISARYVLKYGGYREPQSSSGVIVSTGLGSTGWMKSIIAGATRISESVIGRPYGSKQESTGLDETAAEPAPAPELLRSTAEEVPVIYRKESAKVRRKKSYGPSELLGIVGKWDSKDLLFAVREPFPSKTTGTNLVFGTITEENPLSIESLMGDDGVIFSDGIEADYIRFNSGTEVQITLADKKGIMVL